MHRQQPFAGCGNVYDLAPDVHAADLGASDSPEFLVVVAGYEYDPCAAVGEFDQAPDHKTMLRGKYRPRFHAFEVDDIADEVDCIGADMRQEPVQICCTAGYGPEVHVGQPQRPIVTGRHCGRGGLSALHGDQTTRFF